VEGRRISGGAERRDKTEDDCVLRWQVIRRIIVVGINKKDHKPLTHTFRINRRIGEVNRRRRSTLDVHCKPLGKPLKACGRMYNKEKKEEF
jgi:hypothetical protein